MKTTKEKIEVMRAFEQGKEIETCDADGGKWEAVSRPVWDWYYFDYRIKPETKEPTYRPYESMGEMIEDYCDRSDELRMTRISMPLIWVQKKNTGNKYLIFAFEKNGVFIGDILEGYTDLFNDFTYLDGTPVGKLVE